MILLLCRRAIDAWDARRAASWRTRLGRRGWVVLWCRHADGSWSARLTHPVVRITAVRPGPTRCRAIRRVRGYLATLCPDLS